MARLASSEWRAPQQTSFTVPTDPVLQGVLLGTAIGDALGLPMEGLSARVIQKRFPRLLRYQFLSDLGWVSDDTEQSALVAQSLVRGGGELEGTVRAFRQALLGWFWRLPWGLGFATLRACLKLSLGLRRSGVRSAGNGGAMRAAIVGAYFRSDAVKRERFVRALTEVTHLDERALQGAVFVADVTAATGSALERVTQARARLREPGLVEAVDLALSLAREHAPPALAAQALHTTGFVVHTIGFATYALCCFGDQGADAALQTVLSSGGDTDSIGAIVGAWCGALHGPAGFDPALIDKLQSGPFGRRHLEALAGDLTALRAQQPIERPARFSWPLAMLRNLALYPVVLAHGFRRLAPPYR